MRGVRIYEKIDVAFPGCLDTCYCAPRRRPQHRRAWLGAAGWELRSKGSRDIGDRKTSSEDCRGDPLLGECGSGTNFKVPVEACQSGLKLFFPHDKSLHDFKLKWINGTARNWGVGDHARGSGAAFKHGCELSNGKKLAMEELTLAGGLMQNGLWLKLRKHYASSDSEFNEFTTLRIYRFYISAGRSIGQPEVIRSATYAPRWRRLIRLDALNGGSTLWRSGLLNACATCLYTVFFQRLIQLVFYTPPLGPRFALEGEIDPEGSPQQLASRALDRGEERVKDGSNSMGQNFGAVNVPRRK
ncbi:hypothetical protein BD779DRAFT_1477403 [Infundibulicybe gibba]|nr:hypothetical protein BD779DRAFT_1477403 [Infundibulicybe gibba]